MANEKKEKKTEVKESPKKRGRPYKQAPTDPVSESATTLNMVASQQPVSAAANKNDTQPVTVSQIQQSLTAFYNKILGTTPNTQANWISGVNALGAYNPFLQNQRLKTINSYPGQMDREALIEALNNPQNSEQALRSQSWSLSSSQYIYYKILRMSSDIPMYLHWKVPELLEEKDYKSKDFTNEDLYVDRWIEALNPTTTFKKIALEVKHEGKCSYVLRNSIEKNTTPKSVNYVALQKLPSDYIKITGIGEHGYTISFNFMLFLNPAFSINQYPDFMKKIWNEMIDKGVIDKQTYQKGSLQAPQYKVNPEKLFTYAYNIDEQGHFGTPRGIFELRTNEANSTQKKDIKQKNITQKAIEAIDKQINSSVEHAYMYWVSLPQDLCYTFCSDTSNPWAVPDTSGMMLGLQELTDYDTLAGLLQSTPLTALLTAEVESLPNSTMPGGDQTILSPETIVGYQEKFNEMASDSIQAFFAPLKNFKLQSLPDIPNASNTSTKATQNFIYRNGLGGIIATDRPNVTQVKAAQALIEAECDFVTAQFESVLNFIVNNLIGCKWHWQVHLWGNIFSFDAECKKDKELFVAGGSFVLPKLVSAYHLTLRDTKAIDRYIDTLKIYDDLKTITQVQQEKITKINTNNKNTVETKSQGRPTIDDNELENDSTAASKASGLDTAETRNYEQGFEFDGHCMICGQESDTPICEECQDKYEIDITGGSKDE